MAVTSSKNADLLAAMRGAGTAFGVVTEVAFRVYDISDYHGGVITYKDDTNCTALRSGVRVYIFHITCTHHSMHTSTFWKILTYGEKDLICQQQL